MARDGGLRLHEVLALKKIASDGRRGQAQQGGDAMGAVFGVFPLILIPVLIYNLIAFTVSIGGHASKVREHMMGQALKVPMASTEAGMNVQWIMSWGDVLVLLSLILLFVELLKSTSTGASAIFNHALSMLVFIVCLVEFLLHAAFATSTFFFIMVMSLLDVLAGVIVTIVSARRDVEFDKN